MTSEAQISWCANTKERRKIIANHYHIVSKLDQSKHGGTKADHYYGPGLPLMDARSDAKNLGNERGFAEIAGGVWTDSPDADAFNADPVVQYQYIYIDPCDNAMDFDIPWNAYRDDQGLFHRAPKGEPCTSLIKKEYAHFFFKAD